MGTTFDLRIAQAGDAEAVSQVILSALRETNANDYSQDAIERVEKNFSPAAVLELIGKRKVFVAISAARIIGTASLDGQMMRTVFVAPDVQGQGVGRLLIAKVEQAAREAGVKTLTVPSSVTAEPFYSILGYRAIRDSYHGEERTILMERQLS